MTYVSPYRSLPAAKRIALVSHIIRSSREGRMIFVQRMVSRGGFRAQTVVQWPAEKLASEVVRTKAESSQDERDLLHLLYVELEPQIQITFLDAAGVKHDTGKMDDDVAAPYTDAAAVERGARAVKEAHGEDGLRYLRTLARYAASGWPGIENHSG
jgi:hypothetical protein